MFMYYIYNWYLVSLTMNEIKSLFDSLCSELLLEVTSLGT